MALRAQASSEGRFKVSREAAKEDVTVFRDMHTKPWDSFLAAELSSKTIMPHVFQSRRFPASSPRRLASPNRLRPSVHWTNIGIKQGMVVAVTKSGVPTAPGIIHVARRAGPPTQVARRLARWPARRVACRCM